ncbi:MAG: cell division protein FtsA [Prevotellaceae bacterium]|jgi:cell division protein FtsA|nr:cell division protein FtsA [Prevotellaceae bacterium]
MTKSKLVMVIDIGTTKIAAIAGKVFSNGKMTVAAKHIVESQGVRRGMVENVEETVRSIKLCLEELKKKIDISHLREVSVGIAGRHITSTQNSISVMRPKYIETISFEEVESLKMQMYNMALKPGQEILHVIPQDYYVDGHKVSKIEGCVGSKLTANYHIVIGEVAAIETIKMCIDRCGLKLKKLVLEPLASADAVLTAEEKEEGVVMVDIGGGTSDMIIYHQNIVQSTAVIPCGGEIITNDIRETCCIARNKAEYIKREFGSCFGDMASANNVITFPAVQGHDPRSISSKTLAGIIQARMEEIIEAVVFKIEESGCTNQIRSIVVTGGGSLLSDLPQLVKLHTGLDTRIGYPLIQVEGEPSVKRTSPILSTAIGLVIGGYDHEVGKNGMSKKNNLFSGFPFGKKTVETIISKATQRLDKIFEEEDKPML